MLDHLPRGINHPYFKELLLRYKTPLFCKNFERENILEVKAAYINK